MWVGDCVRACGDCFSVWDVIVPKSLNIRIIHLKSILERF